MAIVDDKGNPVVKVTMLGHEITLNGIHPNYALLIMLTMSLIEEMEISSGRGIEYLQNLRKNYHLEMTGIEADIQVAIQKYRKAQENKPQMKVEKE
jgi:hypothetical protein